MQRSLGRRAMGKLGPASFVPPNGGQPLTKPPTPDTPDSSNPLSSLLLSEVSEVSEVKRVVREETQATTHALSLKRFAPKNPATPDISDTPLQHQGLRPSCLRTETPDTPDTPDRTPARTPDTDLMARPSRPPNPNACIHCGKHCVPSDLESWIRPDGRWTHLECGLTQP
jgi:hypothetical protein